MVDGFAEALAHGENKHCSGEMSNVGLWRLAPAPFPQWRKPAARLSRSDAIFSQRKKVSAATLLEPRAPPVWFRYANFGGFRAHHKLSQVVKGVVTTQVSIIRAWVRIPPM